MANSTVDLIKASFIMFAALSSFALISLGFSAYFDQSVELTLISLFGGWV